MTKSGGGAETPERRGPDDAAQCDGRRKGARSICCDITHPHFQEKVAREHLDDGMPIVELHRDHDIPLSAVRRWIATFRTAGRAGLEREALERNARAKKAEDKRVAKGATPEEVASLRAMLATHAIEPSERAYAEILKRKLVALVPDVVELIHWKNKDKRPGGWSIHEELGLLAALRAKDALHELLSAKLEILSGYAGWFAGLLEQAGCEVETVERPWSQRYKIGDAWFSIPSR